MKRKRFTKHHIEVMKDVWNICCIDEISDAFEMDEQTIIDKARELGLIPEAPQPIIVLDFFGNPVQYIQQLTNSQNH